MSNTKETPRQKMISLMYLILTCLLALNVSREVLQGFVTINESIETTNHNFTSNTGKILEAIAEAIKQGRYEFTPYLQRSKQVNGLTESTYAYVDTLKKELLKYTEDKEGADTLTLGEVEKLDDYDKPTYFLIGDDETQPKTGRYSALELKRFLTNYCDSVGYLLDYMKDRPGLKLPEQDYKVLKEKIQLLRPHDNYRDADGQAQSWEMKQFYNLPLAAVITNLSKLQGDLRNLEGELINTFASAPGKLSVTFNLMQARIVPNSYYVQSGSPFVADVFLSATSSDFKEDNVQFILGEVDTATGKTAPDALVLPVENGTGKITIPTAGIGDKEAKGWIKFKDGLGRYKYYPYTASYKVANAAVAVSPDYMNLFYVGIENPVTVSAAGVAPHNLAVSIDGCGGKLTDKGNGKYTVDVNTAGKCTIRVSQKTPTGLQPQGKPLVFRVKKVPNPLLRVNAKTVSGNENFSVSEARNIRSLTIDNSGFEFNAPFEMVSFRLSYGGRGMGFEEKTLYGTQLDAKTMSDMQRINKGGKIYFEDILIKAPDGPRKLPPIIITVK